VGQIRDEFEANEVAAHTKYNEKLIAISGYVDSVAINDFTGEPYVNLVNDPEEWTLCWVRCEFSVPDMDELAGLAEGDHLVVVGDYDQYLLCSVIIDHCEIE